MRANIRMIAISALRAVQHELSLWYRSILEITKLNLNDSLTRKISMLQSREMMRAKKYVITKHFVNNPKPTDLKLIEEELPVLQDGGKCN